MENTEKYFIACAYNEIANMPANCNRISWNKYPVEMVVDNETLITRVDGIEYRDVCPMRGTRRNRVEMGKVVCKHICDTWGGTMDEVTEYGNAFIAELYQVLGIQ